MQSIQAGQICEVKDKDPSDVFIVTGNTSKLPVSQEIEMVRLRDLQRNLSNPSGVTPVHIPRTSLKVIAEDSETYIRTWNKGG